MPTHVAIPPQVTYFVRPLGNGEPRPAHLLQRRGKEAYVHYVGTDKRLDEWVTEERCFLPAAPSRTEPYSHSVYEEQHPTPGSSELHPEIQLGDDSAAAEPLGPRVAGPSSHTPTTTQGGEDAQTTIKGSISAPPMESTSKKRKRVGRPSKQSTLQREMRDIESASASPAPEGELGTVLTEEIDMEQHKKITAQRNFENVKFGEWQVKTWYFSPYPLTETELEDPVTAPEAKIPGVQKTTARSHGRTSDILAGGLGRSATAGSEKAQLWVCQQCFKYMSEGTSYDLHVKYCNVDYPPGRRVYQRGAHSIWEVDGAVQKLYCQNLALFGKLFIDVKTLYFDLDNFHFYILTESTSKQDHMLGYFSKEKNSYDDYNLATIMTLPPYQRKGYGMLMIEFSYELSRRAGKVGTPERPLSDLGLRSYLAYWVSTLVRFFRTVLSTLPTDTMRIEHYGRFPGIERTPSGDSEPDSGNVSGANSNMGNGSSVNGNGNVNETDNGPISSNGNGLKRKKPKKSKGWAGEVEDAWPESDDVPFYTTDPMFTTDRKLVTHANEDGSATTHVVLNCTLADIARATNLRVDDAAFALNEVGMLAMRIAAAEGTSAPDIQDGTVLLTKVMIEKVAKERNVKKPCMRMPYVIL
ncbi:hypothetical protein H0H87_002684 [Tephrocybe sp. NHM501043]|nr:hypothetical protein H0H87_002684 [Tephrocybe sp. NHM501043]